MSPEEEKYLQQRMDEVYAIGFKNGQIEMQNRVLKLINTDLDIMAIRNSVDVAMHFIKRIKKMRYTREFTNFN